MAFLSVAMPHYNKANNKHYNISTSKPLQGKFEYFCTPVFIHIHATELLQDCPLACTILHAQSQVCNSTKSYLLGLGA